MKSYIHETITVESRTHAQHTDKVSTKAYSYREERQRKTILPQPASSPI